MDELAQARRDYERDQQLDQLARELNLILATSDRRKLVDLAKRLANDHLTLQQCKMVFALAYVKAVADYPYTDLRNEDSIKAAKAIVAEHPELFYRDSICLRYI